MTLFHVLAGLLGVLAVLDVVTTLKALKNPKLKEANPLVRVMMKHGKVWIVVKLAVTIGAMWWLQSAPLLLVPIAAVYTYVVYNNAKQAGMI